MPSPHVQHPLSARSRNTAAGATVIVTGEIDARTAPTLHRLLDDARVTSSPVEFVVDLRDVSFLSAAGLSVLVSIHRNCALDGTAMRIVADHSAVRRPMEVTGLRWLLSD
jgi:anti-sigma B factor antagonist